ncbi:hypothetical protein LSAT2_009122 [Lamellibrachia satsuma]|nr:hypothetical protein LSAT2_009122 [Lamellibrachia satsuma]
MVMKLVSLLTLAILGASANLNEACVKKVQACGSTISDMLIKGLSSNPFPMLTGTGVSEIICSEKDDFAACLNQSAPECPSDMIKTWRNQLDQFNTTCQLLPCSKQINECIANLTSILMKPKFDVATLHKVCNEYGAYGMCVQRATKCSAELIQNYTETLDLYKAKCTQIAECGQSLKDCSSESVKAFTSSVGTHKFNVTTLENLCADKDDFAACLKQTEPECPAYMIDPLRFQLAQMDLYCKLIPCGKKVQACGSTISRMLIERFLSNRTSKLLSTGVNDIICSEKDDFAACLGESVPECPAQMITTWRKQLDSLNASCTLLPCTKKVQACGEKDDFAACLGEAVPECPPQMITTWRKQLDTLNASCTLLPCTKKVQACGSTISGMLIKELSSNQTSLLFSTGINEIICTEKDDFAVCLGESVPECPPQMINTWRKQLDSLNASCTLLPCSKQLNECNANLTSIVMKPKFDVATLHKLCNEYGAFGMCVQRATKCPAEVIRTYTGVVDFYKAKCTQIAECGQTLTDCAGESFKAFTSAVGTGKFDVTTLEKLCADEENLTKCLKNSTTCPTEYLNQYETILATVRKHCSSTACAMKAQKCGSNIFDGINFKKLLNKESSVTFCTNLVRAQKCLSALNEECSAWKNPMTFWVDRCTEIVKKDACARHVCKNGGTCVASLEDVKCVCVAGFRGANCDEKPQMTTTVALPSGQGGVRYTTLAIVASVIASVLTYAGYV